MSFRARLTVFFVIIVVIPMTAVGLLAFGLIDGSNAGKADARAAGVLSAARSVYARSSRSSSLAARSVARELALTPVAELPARAALLARRGGFARITITVAGEPPISAGNPSAVAPGLAIVKATNTRPQRTFEVSSLTAAAFADELAGPGTEVIVRRGGATLGASPSEAGRAVPRAVDAGGATVRLGSARYQIMTQQLVGFDAAAVRVSVLSNLARTSASLTHDRVLATGFIVAFLLVALLLALLVSRSLHDQVSLFLTAARRLGGGDFSEPVPTSGRDEFAALGEEFNSMSRQLRHRLDELEQERERFRASVRRIGEAFASGLDRGALLELMLRTAMDATESDRGRVSARSGPTAPLRETERTDPLLGLEQPFAEAEREAVQASGVGYAVTGDTYVAAVALGAIEPGGPTHGVITVSREGRRFTDDDLELLRSLASRATLALTNVNLHNDVARQAVTDDLTGLASRGHFAELLETAMCGLSRPRRTVGVAMFDIDNFKSVNDTYGHQQGDLMLRRVADVLRETCREADIPARYGGEELAVILPDTDLNGAYELAERARAAIEAMAIPRLDHQGWLKLTTSVGVAVSDDGRAETLVSAADAALYAAKRTGKNRTVRADEVPRDADGARELARSAAPSPDE